VLATQPVSRSKLPAGGLYERWKGFIKRMKKMMVLGLLLLVSAAASGHAQESRQDISVSGSAFFEPSVTGNAVHSSGTGSLGALISYRYMLTPRSALEMNYGFTQFVQKYTTSFQPNERIHARAQEITGAYVYSLNFGNLNPFAEAGIGGLIFTPIQDYRTSTHDARQNTNVGLLLGAGLAYELSPSFDIRAEYRVFGLKTPDFGFGNYKTNKYEVISMPAIGIAYHF
jgi:opacity protein-like surface antigen